MVEDDLLDEGEGGGEAAASGDVDDAETAVAGAACLSCGAETAGVFCVNCGQKNDDLRRSLFLLARDFVEDTFSFDSRMWRTLGLMAVAPGVVATNYAHGRRSRYTPPVRLFLVVSFLFFLTITLTRTVFVAVEITPKTAEQIAQEKEMAAAYAEAAKSAGVATQPEDGVIDIGEGRVIQIGGEDVDCKINFYLRFFSKVDDIEIDQEGWRRCADSISAAADVSVTSEDGAAEQEDSDELQRRFDEIMLNISSAVEDPLDFNREINAWLPRVMFFMAPFAAFMTGLFIRGRDALFFDHMVMSLYSHAVAFALVGIAILLTQAGVPYGGLGAGIGLFLYSVMALKKAYGRGWVKTIYSAAMIGFLYLIVLSAAVMFIVWQIISQ